MMCSHEYKMGIASGLHRRKRKRRGSKLVVTDNKIRTCKFQNRIAKSPERRTK